MNAQFKTDLSDFNVQVSEYLISKDSTSSMTHLILKVDVLHYLRKTKQTFLNLGSVIINQNDGRLFIFNHHKVLTRIDRIKI